MGGDFLDGKGLHSVFFLAQDLSSIKLHEFSYP